MPPPQHQAQSYPKPQGKYMSGFNYNDRRHNQNSDVKVVRTNDPISLYCHNCQA